jgi:hypothetical protein
MIEQPKKLDRGTPISVFMKNILILNILDINRRINARPEIIY